VQLIRLETLEGRVVQLDSAAWRPDWWARSKTVQSSAALRLALESTPGTAARVLEFLRWGKQPRCRCGSLDCRPRPPGSYRCEECAYEFNAQTGTLRHRSRLSPDEWLFAAKVLATGATPCSASQFYKQVGLSSKETAARLHLKLLEGFARIRPPLQRETQLLVVRLRRYPDRWLAVVCDSRGLAAATLCRELREVDSFVRARVDPGSRVLSDEFLPAGQLLALGEYEFLRVPSTWGERASAPAAIAQVHALMRELRQSQSLDRSSDERISRAVGAHALFSYVLDPAKRFRLLVASVASVSVAGTSRA